MLLRSQLLSGANSVAHLVGLGRPAVKRSKTTEPTVAAPPAVVIEGNGGAPADPPAPPPPAPAPAAPPPAAAAPPATVPPAAAKPAKSKDGEDEEDDGEDEEDDDDEVEMKGKGKKASARRRERSRIRAIINSPHAAKNPTVAMHLALESRITRQDAIAMLEAMPKGGGGLDALMANVARPNVQPNRAAAPVNDKQAIAASWDGAWSKATGRRQQLAANDPWAANAARR